MQYGSMPGFVGLPILQRIWMFSIKTAASQYGTGARSYEKCSNEQPICQWATAALHRQGKAWRQAPRRALSRANSLGSLLGGLQDELLQTRGQGLGTW